MLWLAYSFKRKNKGFELSAKRIKREKGVKFLKGARKVLRLAKG